LIKLSLTMTACGDTSLGSRIRANSRCP